MTERDPNGFSPHVPGAKLDDGKVRIDLILDSMPRALERVAMVGTKGAIKYTENGWLQVPDGEKRYRAAGYRHQVARAKGELIDPDTELEHLAHEAWNKLAELELYLRGKEQRCANQ